MRGSCTCAPDWNSKRAEPPSASVWYNQVRDTFEYSGEDISDMDGPGAVPAAHAMIQRQASATARMFSKGANPLTITDPVWEILTSMAFGMGGPRSRST